MKEEAWRKNLGLISNYPEITPTFLVDEALYIGSNSRKKRKNKEFALIISLLFWTQIRNSEKNLIYRLI